MKKMNYGIDNTKNKLEKKIRCIKNVKWIKYIIDKI